MTNFLFSPTISGGGGTGEERETRPDSLLSTLSLSQSPPHMDLTPHTPPSHCILQVLLVSPPTRQTSLNISSQERTKPFSPWKPGDAYSVEDDLTDWRLLLGSIDDGDQTRYRLQITGVQEYRSTEYSSIGVQEYRIQQY